MDDYRDLVTAGFALLCAALMLVAGLLFILSTDDSKPASEIEPSKRVAPLAISESSQVPLLQIPGTTQRRTTKLRAGLPWASLRSAC
jgi:hypothetical protein